MTTSRGRDWNYAETLHQAAALLYIDNYINKAMYESLMKEIVNDWLDEEQGHQMLWNAGLAD